MIKLEMVFYLFPFCLAILEAQRAQSESYPLVHKVENFYPGKHDVYTGYITVDEKSGSKLFYQIFSAMNKPITAHAPLIVWIEGGPGGSSVFAIYEAMGPYDVIKEGVEFKLRVKNVTWNDHNHFLFIDAPVRTGFSPGFGDYRVRSTVQATENLLKFFEEFYKIPDFIHLKRTLSICLGRALPAITFRC